MILDKNTDTIPQKNEFNLLIGGYEGPIDFLLELAKKLNVVAKILKRNRYVLIKILKRSRYVLIKILKRSRCTATFY